MSRLGFALLLQRRVARRDLPLLVVTVLLTAVALVCALGAPALLARTLDRAAQQAVAAAGRSADVVARAPVADQIDAVAVPPIAPADVAGEAARLRDRLPVALRRVTEPATAAVIGPQLRLGADDVAPELRNGPVGVRIAVLARPDAVRLTSGALPATSTAPDGTVDVVLSSAAAEAASLRVGSVVDVPSEAGLVRGATLRLRVTGIVGRRAVAGPSPWTDDGPVWAAQQNLSGSGPTIRVTVLTDVAGISRASAEIGAFTAALRLQVDADRVTAATTPAIARVVAEVRTRTDLLAGGSGNEYTVTSSLPEAVSQAAAQAGSARAQVALLTSGVLGTAAVALVLLGGLLAARRRDAIALQRARGASAAAIALPVLIESAVLVLVAGTIAAVVTRSSPTAPGAAVAVVALLAAPVRVALTAAAGAVRRAPADRADRARISRIRGARRVVLEVGLVLVAAIGVLVLQAGDGLGAAGSDPLLVVVPLLAAAALTVVLLRLLPPAIAVVARLARRSRGVAGVLVAARTGAGIGLPLLALCIAFGLALNDGMLVATIASGQEAASWERIGADARASTAVDVAGAPGVRHAATVAALPGVSLDLATSGATATVLGVDAGYASLAGALPGAAAGTTTTLRRLADGPAPSTGALPVVVDAALARMMVGRALQLQIDSRIIPARAVGTVAAGPSGYLAGPFVLVDLDALRRRVPSVRASTTLVIGPGAGVALRRAGVPSAAVLTRASWLATQRSAPLVAGTRLATLLAALLLAVFAVAALIAAILAGAPERRRVLSLLRTLGMRRRTGWWLLAADVLPLVAGGLLGGTAIGVIAAEVLDPALALAALTGGSADPPVTISAGVVAAMLGGTILVLACAVAAEALTWRRDRIAEVLRVGGTGS